MTADSWAARTAAVEGSYFRAEQAHALRKHLEHMVAQGKLPAASLQAPQVTEYQTRSTLPEHQLKFKYKRSLYPALSRSPAADWKLGTQVSFGRGRWVTPEASVWDVQSGSRLAQTPSKQATWADELRQKRLAKAQYESPLVQGYRLLPQFTPGKAFFWGTVLSFWGTGMATLLVAKRCGLSLENLPEKARQFGEPWKQALRHRLDPLKDSWSATSSARRDALKSHETEELFAKMRAQFAAH